MGYLHCLKKACSAFLMAVHRRLLYSSYLLRESSYNKSKHINVHPMHSLVGLKLESVPPNFFHLMVDKTASDKSIA